MSKTYLYSFLSQDSIELAQFARDIEYSVFTSPRMMLTSARSLAEDIVNIVIKKKGISDIGCNNFIDRINLLQSYNLIPKDVLDAIHHIRKLGNDAAHDSRPFRISDALSSWERLYVLISWYMKGYVDAHFKMPPYQEPYMENNNQFNVQELDLRLKKWQEAILDQMSQITSSTDSNSDVAVLEKVEKKIKVEDDVEPGETIIRTISYKNDSVDVPDFLRDAFLLPQRFEKSERFMIALGGAQQARIMSELPDNSEGISSCVKRFKEDNERLMFQDLCQFIEVEKTRRNIEKERRGELLLFFRSEYVVMTEELSKTPLDEEHFKGIPNFLKQLQEDGIMQVGQLPKELLILAKYDRVGIGTVQKLFNQIKLLQAS